MTSPQTPPTQSIPRPDPDFWADVKRPEPDPDLPNPGRYEKRSAPKSKPRRAIKPSLLSREDWGTACIVAGMCGVASFICASAAVILWGWLL